MTTHCVDTGLHQWPDDFDSDNWQRCMRGCGCGRPRLGRWPGRLYGPEEVPALASEPVATEPRTRLATSSHVRCVAENGRHSWPIRADRDGWVRCVREGCGTGRRWNERTARLPEQVPPSPGPFTDEELSPSSMLAREQASAPAEVGMAPHQRLAPCDRCGARMLLERDVDGDLEQVCINGHRRYGRSPQELAEMLAQEAAAHTGKQRRREPSHGGARL